MFAMQRNPSLRGFYHAMFAAILSILLLMLSWPWLVLNPLRPDSTGQEQEAFWGDMTQIVGPRHRLRFNGVTYDVTAARLSMVNLDSQQMMIDAPVIQAQLPQGQGYRISAKQAVFDRQQKIMLLQYDVVFSNQRGGNLRTQSAEFLLEQSRISGNTRIYGQLMPQVSIVAEGFRWQDSDNPVQFLGATTMRVHAATDAARKEF